MAGVITTGSLPKLLWPGIKTIWGLTYEKWDNGAQWRQIFEVAQSDKNYEEDVSLVGFGLAPPKAEGDAIVYDTMKQGYVSRYTNVTYALGFIITQEEIEDCQYAQVSAQRTKSLAFSMQQTEENVGANILNRAFDTNYQGGDGKCLVASDHPLDSGTASNTLTVAADLSEASLEQAAIDIMGFVDNRGNKIKIMPRKLVIPRQLAFEATRLLKNENRPETANRDVNAIYLMGTFPEGSVVNQYLTDSDAWFILTNCPDGLKKMERVAMSFANDNDFDTTNMKFRARTRYTFGWTDWRGIYGSPGA